MATAKAAAGKTAPAPTKAKGASAGTPLNPKDKKRLHEECGIDADTEEDARVKILKVLKANEITNVDGDSLTDLIEYVTAFPAGNGEEEEEAPAPKSKKKAAPVEDEEEEEVTDDEEGAEEEDPDLPPAPKAKAKAAGAKKPTIIEVDDEETEELVDEVKGKGLTSGKKAGSKKAAAKKEGSARAHKLLGVHWDTLTDQQKLKATTPLKKFLPENQFRINFLTRSFIVKYIGKTAEHNIFKYHLLRLLDDGKLEGIFVTHKFKTPDEFAEYLPPVEEREGLRLIKGASCSVIHPFHIDRLIDLLGETDFLKNSIAVATSQDKRMASNHEKLKSQLGDGKKATPAPKSKAKAAPVEEEEEEGVEVEVETEEEEEETPAPAKKVTATTTKKPAAAPAPAKKPAAPTAPAAKKAPAPAPAAPKKATPAKK